MTGLLDYPLLSAPTISLPAFTQVLHASGSPIAGEAKGVYDAFVAKGINPAIGLAIAQHESSFGKAGIAVGRDNPFGDRYYAGAATFGATNAGGWAKFPSYTAAAQYEAALLAGPKYAGSTNANTARSFAQVYAPSSDGNNPSSYGSKIVAAVTAWGGGAHAIAAKPSSGSTAPTKAKATKKAVASGSLGAYARQHQVKIAGGGLGLVLLLVIL